MFLGKREESRDFDVFFFFWSVFGLFLVVGKGKNIERNWIEKKFQKKCVSPQFDRCLGLFIAPSAFFEATAIVGPLALNHL